MTQPPVGQQERRHGFGVQELWLQHQVVISIGKAVTVGVKTDSLRDIVEIV